VAAYVVTLRFLTRVAELCVWVQAPEKREGMSEEEVVVQEIGRQVVVRGRLLSS
jgi:hypothetical protein